MESVAVTEAPEGGTGEGAAAMDPRERVRTGWRELWQVPVLLGALVLLGAGLVLAVASKPAPTFGGALDRAEALIESGRHTDALGVLNERVRVWVERKPEVVPLEDRQRYHVLGARAIFEGQDALGIDHEENHATIVREYRAAEALGAVLGPRDLHHLAATYASMGDEDLALDRAAAIPEESRALRDGVYRQVVTRWMGSEVLRHDRAAELLSRMLTDPMLGPQDRVWALGRRADVQMEQGYVQEAIDSLLRAIPRLGGAEEASGAAELHLKLAQAYLRAASYPEAQAQAQRALDAPGVADEVRAGALLVLGNVSEARGETSRARDLYGEIDEQYNGSSAYGSALLGLGQTQAALGAVEASLDAYGRLVEHLSGPGAGPLDRRGEALRGEAAGSLLARYLEQSTVREYETALRYAGLASGLFPADGAPAEVVQAIADGHRASADRLLGQVGGEGLGADPAARIAALEPSTRAETQRHLLRSGAYYRKLADGLVLTDNDRFADALWASAEQFDRAGDLASAIDAYRAFGEGVPDDARRAEATYRRGRAHQALGDYASAAGCYEELVEERRSGRAGEVGPFAVLSLVPLAQCYQLDGKPENDAQAEQLLEAALDGSTGDAGAPQYRDALVELGTLLYHSGRYERAIERLTEAAARYPDDPQTVAVRFRLADAQRLLAQRIASTLSEPMPESERREREAQVGQLRREAMEGFTRVRDRLGALDARMRGALDRLYLRNSVFYLGDCAFDLGDYAAAIQHYDAARERYPDDPASLVAMVQIVNAYVEQGDLRRARTANERARRFYMNLPEEAWADPNLPMDRQDWERWLESSALLYEVADR